MHTCLSSNIVDFCIILITTDLITLCICSSIRPLNRSKFGNIIHSSFIPHLYYIVTTVIKSAAWCYNYVFVRFIVRFFVRICELRLSVQLSSSLKLKVCFHWVQMGKPINSGSSYSIGRCVTTTVVVNVFFTRPSIWRYLSCFQFLYPNPWKICSFLTVIFSVLSVVSSAHLGKSSWQV